MLTLYFSATGNARYIAELLCREMGGRCMSIEARADFDAEIAAHGVIAFCYPVYGSRVPRIMREFVARHMPALTGKRLVICAVQNIFSGDAARAFTDMFDIGAVEVVYAEHFNMPNNICNTPLLRPTSSRKIERYKRKAELKVARMCDNMRRGVVKRRGFSWISRRLGSIQGNPWARLELKAMSGVKIHPQCNACKLCTKICPMQNLTERDGRIQQCGNCILCYRCVNQCPQRAITVLFHKIPKWQYKGVERNDKIL